MRDKDPAARGLRPALGRPLGGTLTLPGKNEYFILL
jgi:hypothetical protein